MATQERIIIESMFQIPDKSGRDVPFKLNEVQATLDANLTGRDVIPKMRQPGISSYYLARYTAACLSKRNVRAVIISHESKATERLLMRVQYILQNIRGPKPVIKNMSRNEITFPKTNSMFYIGTAGAKKFGRGDTITHLHCSEVAFWENARELMGGLMQAVPKDGEVGLESTGNGKGNYYHQRVMSAAKGRSRYRLHFFGWLFTDEYRYDLSPQEEEAFLKHLDKDLEEDQLIEIPGIDAGRLAWRRDKLEEIEYDLRLFRQEYPITLDDCFQGSGSSIFHKINYVPTDAWTRVDNSLWLLDDHPLRDHTYVIGADVGGGLGGDSDNSVAEIIDVTAGEQVGEWLSNKVEPDRFGSEVLPRLGKTFNNAMIAVESNNHGILTLAKLRDSDYPDYLIYRSGTAAKRGEEINRLAQLGFRTTTRSRPFLIGNLRLALATSLVIHSPILMDELGSFVEKEGGKMEAQDGCHDDTVIACAMAEHVRDKAAFLLGAEDEARSGTSQTDPFSLEGMLENLSGRHSSFPIPSHAASADPIQAEFGDLYYIGDEDPISFH